MAVTPEWRLLPSTPSAAVPPLLVSIETGPADYTVRLTDMANVWIEALDRRRICMRAWDQDTSIDPSDTPENMSKFLTSLRSALDSFHNGHDQTSLAILPGSSGEAGADGLVLKISCEIPGLQTLRWTMQLSKAPTSAVATNVVLPLLQAQLARAQEVEALMELVRRKDSVLTKLLDKLEATGTGLENIFNSLSTSFSGRKKVSRAAAAEKVRGLAPFNQEKWQEEMRTAADGPADVTSLMASVFSGNSLRYESSMEVEETPGLDRWWHTFQGTKEVPLHSRPSKASGKADSPPPLNAEATADDDDFQVQSTPPGLHSSRAQGTNHVTATADDDATASEDNASPPPSSAKKSPKPKGPPGKGAGRLGTIGGKRQPSKQPSPSPEPEKPQEVSAQPTHDSETASEAEDDDPTASLPNSSPPPPSSKPTPRKAGLGRIGGPKPNASQTGSVPRSTSPDERPKQTSTPRKLGIIGKRAADKASGGGDDNARGRSRETSEAVKEAPRETSQERADRKRDQLKRELEKKAAAGPAKKKRKF